ncbi:FAD-dependent monooxygenase [Nocardia arthritidis]|uniref:FAD-dependent monooxygenase n=1 Tax=Nocardia arthritidis TaxID=228602 RepID=UPI00142D77D1|nr:FAD-dependent monooxygenase [Nocardia arthritidis]
MDGSRVGIIGGSIAGCAAAVVLRRAGCDVTVFERSSGRLRDRGHGVGLSAEVRAELAAADLIDAELPAHSITQRSWYVRDGDAPLGRLLWEQSFTTVVHNWGMLWANLRKRVADNDYRDGVPVNHIEPDADSVTLRRGDGTAERFDIVFGADGYGSAVRALVDPAASVENSGYVVWRGGYSVTELPQPVPDALHDQIVTVAYTGGHCLIMITPDPRPGVLRVYWGLYHKPAQPFSSDTDEAPGDSLPGLDAVLSADFPPYWAEVIAKTSPASTVVHPVVDIRSSSYVAHRLALIGDAGTVARPHTGSGAVKAVQDALTLGRLCREHGNWAELLAAYDAQRCPAGTALVELGRRLGQAQVTETPPWSSMTPDDFTEWIRSVLAGRRLYLYEGGE